MNARVLGFALFGMVAGTATLLWGTTIPLGVPGEWTWPRLPATAETLVGAGVALAAGCLYVGFVLWGRRRIGARRRAAMTAQLLLLVVVAFAWLAAIQQCVPPPSDLGKVPYVLYYPRSSGYFWQARHEATDPVRFLTTYEELLAEQDYLHIGTHPPGLTLAYRGLLAVCESSPGFCDAVLATCPASVSESLRTITALSVRSGQAVTTADRATLWLAAIITLFAAAATTVGMYALVRRHFDRSTAWTVAGLWPLVPAIAVFHPKSDTLYPLLAVGAAALWLTACDRRSLLRALGAGLVLWLGMLLSLAYVTVGLLIAVMTLWEGISLQRDHDEPAGEFNGPATTGRDRALLLLAGATGFVIPTVCLGVFGEINLPNVWRWNLANHALFYEHNMRTWGKWLLVNPLELALAVGLPVCLAGTVALVRLVKGRKLWSEQAALSVPFLLVWGLLWVSGKNMGEAARLWILLMPWAVMSAAPAFGNRTGGSRASSAGDAPTDNESPDGGSAGNGSTEDAGTASGTVPGSTTGSESSPRANSSDPRTTFLVTMVLAAQMLVCVLTVLRIDGFQFTELTQPIASQPAEE